MKRFLASLFLCIGFTYSGNTQTTTEPQPFPLKDYKISFYEIQMNVKTVQINTIDGSEISGNQPLIIRDESTNSFTIDFTDCSEGEYLISGKRDDLELEYSVNR